MNKQEVIAVLEQERTQLLDKLHSLDLTILTLKQSSAYPEQYSAGRQHSELTNGHKAAEQSTKGRYKDYPKGDRDNRDKVKIILKTENRFLHMRELVSIAQELEPHVDHDVVKRRIQQAVYSLKALDPSPIISISVNNNNQNVFWGSKKWVTDKGEVKPEHAYDEAQLLAKAEEIEI